MRKLIISFCALWLCGNVLAADVAGVNNLKHTVITQTENIQKIQQSLLDLQAQLQKVTADFNLFKEQATVKIDIITANSTALQDKVLTLSQSVNATNQKVVVLQKVQSETQQGLLNRWSRILESWNDHLNFGVAGTIFGLVVVLLLVFLLRYKIRQKKLVSPSALPNIEEQGEYDLMNSAEGIPAKLNLARAYIEMGNKNEAHHILQEVLKCGNEEQQKEAQMLLNGCEG